MGGRVRACVCVRGVVGVGKERNCRKWLAKTRRERRAID